MSNSEKLKKIRHSTAHILAQAVTELFPEVKFGIGPTISDGFYYDFDLQKTLKSEDLPRIEKKMRQLIKKNIKFERKTISKEKAFKIFEHQPYKLELIKELIRNHEAIIVYQSGEFIDLCKGPHVETTKEINPDAFKLLKVAGAYWRGDENNKMLQRVYGTAFTAKVQLEKYLQRLKEIEEHDHRLLNNTLHLYSIKDEVGAGLVLLHPKGAIIRNEIEKFWKEEHLKRDYQYIYTPHIGKSELWRKSGHLEFYRENMYPLMELDNTEYAVKPMNCPFHIYIFKSEMRSYRDLPIRYCELGTVYRYEKSGTLHGLFRVRSITQDDAHIFCRQDQIVDEVANSLGLAIFMMKTFGFKKFDISLSVRDPENKKKYLGSDEVWIKAEKALAEALKKKKIKYQRCEGEAVFYGPKIDICLLDSLGRSWQGPTIQIDFNLPEKFDVNYIDRGGKKARIVMVHRTVIGAMERFLGNLMEEYAGAFPIWLSPVQVQIIPVGSKHIKHSHKLADEFKKHGLRVEVDDLNETVGYKIRKAEQQKVPYMLVIGDKEMKTAKLAVRGRGKKRIQKINKKNFIQKVLQEIKDKK